VQSTLTGATTSINAGNGIGSSNTVNIGSNAPLLSGTLANIAGPVNVSSTSGNTTLNVDDSGDSTGQTVAVTNSSISGSWSPSAINYSNTTFGAITAVILGGGSGGNTFNVQSTLASAATSINAGNGLSSTNTVTIGSLAPSLGGTLASIAGPVVVSNTSGSTSLTVDDSGDTTGQTVAITNSSITGTWSAPINYVGGEVSSLTVLGGSGSNTFNVQSTASGTPVGLNAGSGADVVSVGNGADGVQDVQADLALEGPAITLTVDDSADGTGRTATLDTFTPGGETLPFGRISGLAPAVISYELADVASPITINGGSGGNTFAILSTGSQTLNLNSGTGNDSVNVQALSGPLNLDGNGGSDTVTLGSLAPALGGVLANLNATIAVTNSAGSTALIVDDSGDSTAHPVTITSSSVAGLSPQAINYGAGVTSVTVNGGSGVNTYKVQSTAAATGVILNAGSVPSMSATAATGWTICKAP
jgi:hypothetical protein